MRALPALALTALLLVPGCARALPTAKPQGAATAVAAASTIELRRAVRAHLVMAFDWADADRDGLLVMAEAEKLGIDQGDFLRRDRDQNGALQFTEVQGADGLTAEVHRLRELAVALGDAHPQGLDRAAWLASKVALAPQPYTPTPDAGLKAALFAPADADQDGRLALRELETLFGRATELGYKVEGGAKARR